MIKTYTCFFCDKMYTNRHKYAGHLGGHSNLGQPCTNRDKLIGRKRTKEECESISKGTADWIKERQGWIGKVGKFYSKKNNRTLHYDSAWELHAFKRLEQASAVIAYDRCNFYIDYVYNGKTRRYVPDILVTYKDDFKEIIEVKPAYKLKENKIKSKHLAALEYCKENGV